MSSVALALGKLAIRSSPPSRPAIALSSCSASSSRASAASAWQTSVLPASFSFGPLHLGSDALPQWVVVLCHRHPTRGDRLQLVGSHQHVISVNAHSIIEADTHQHHSANQVGRHRVAVAAYLNVAIPTHVPMLYV